jgi:hypothetical protein
VVPHLRTSEDEYSIVNEGGIGFRSGDREAVPARTAITKPRGEMWSDHPSRTEFVARHATLGASGRRLADLDDQKRAMFLIDKEHRSGSHELNLSSPDVYVTTVA